MPTPFIEGMQARTRYDTARQNVKIGENALKAQHDVRKAREAFLAGDQGAGRRLITISPEAGTQAFDALDQREEREREGLRRKNAVYGNAAAWILQAPPEEQPRRYAMARAQFDPYGAMGMPEQFDPQYVQWQLAQRAEFADLYDFYTGKAERAEEHGYKLEEIEATGQNALMTTQASQDAQSARAAADRAADASTRVTDRTNALADAEADQRRKIELEREKARLEAENKKPEKPEGLSASESNAIRSAAVGFFGGRVDPFTGEVIGILDEKAGETNALAARAEELFADAKRAGRPIGVNQAVQRAAQEKQDGATAAAGNDPLGIRGGAAGGGQAPRLRYNPTTGLLE